MSEGVGAVRGQRLELVARRHKRQPGDGRNLVREQRGKSRMRVETGAHRGAALRQRIELLERQPVADDAAVDLRGVAGEFLSQRQRRRVLGVGAPNLDDPRELLALAL